MPFWPAALLSPFTVRSTKLIYEEIHEQFSLQNLLLASSRLLFSFTLLRLKEVGVWSGLGITRRGSVLLLSEARTSFSFALLIYISQPLVGLRRSGKASVLFSRLFADWGSIWRLSLHSSSLIFTYEGDSPPGSSCAVATPLLLVAGSSFRRSATVENKTNVFTYANAFKLDTRLSILHPISSPPQIRNFCICSGFRHLSRRCSVLLFSEALVSFALFILFR